MAISVGYHQANKSNENEFLHSAWVNNENANEYFKSNRLKRANDLMIRNEKIVQK